MKIHDEVVIAMGLHGRAMQYRLRIWRRLDVAFFVVLFTELDDNPGVSVTNWSEHLATAALKRFTYLSHENTIWVENYQCQMESLDPFKDDAWDRFHQITYTHTEGRLHMPTWRRLDRDGLKVLTDEDVDLLEKGAPPP